MSDLAQAYTVVMPRLGLSMTEGTIVSWHKQEGQHVAKGELLFSFESDKSTLEIEAPAEGRLHILVPAGQTVPVQTPVAQIGEGAHGRAPTAALAEPDAGREADATAMERSRPSGRGVAASPRARALARRRGQSLEPIRGSGPRGMIVAADLESTDSVPPLRATPLARRRAAAAGLNLAAVTGSGPQQRITRSDVEHALASGPGRIPARAAPLAGLKGLRAVIAERLSQGWHERPQVTLTSDADATDLAALRETLSRTTGQRFPYDALFAWTVARALREFPYMNATLAEEGIRLLPGIHLGVAVQTDRGLLVPVVRDADRRDLLDLQRELIGLAERALQGRSLPDELTGGTFTITNLGMFGIDAFTPIVNPPEAAILGIGRIAPRPVAREGRVVLRSMVALSLSFDHRLIDGAPAARFLARVRELIEAPEAVMPDHNVP